MGVESMISRNSQHALYCKLLGMPENFDEAPTPSIWRGRRKEDKHLKGLYPRVRASYKWHTLLYWLIATVSTTFLMLQLVFGAALTALGSTKTDQVAFPIVLLGAIQTVIGGFITYFKSANQPNRSRQFRVSLRKVLDAIENGEVMLRDPDFKPPPYRPIPSNDTNAAYGEHWLSGEAGTVVTGVEGMVLRLLDMYADAVKDAENNNPGSWMSTNRASDQAAQVGMKDLLAELKKNNAVKDDTVSINGSIASSNVAPTTVTFSAPPATTANTSATTGATLKVPQAGPTAQPVAPVTSQPTSQNIV